MLVVEELWELQPPGTVRDCPGPTGIALPLPYSFRKDERAEPHNSETKFSFAYRGGVYREVVRRSSYCNTYKATRRHMPDYSVVTCSVVTCCVIGCSLSGELRHGDCYEHVPWQATVHPVG